MRSAKRVTTIVPATSRKRIVAALELPGYLLVGRSTSRHKHHVKAREAEDGNRQNGDESHQAHGYDGLRLTQSILAVEHVEKREREDAQHVNRECD